MRGQYKWMQPYEEGRLSYKDAVGEDDNPYPPKPASRIGRYIVIL